MDAETRLLIEQVIARLECDVPRYACKQVAHDDNDWQAAIGALLGAAFK